MSRRATKRAGGWILAGLLLAAVAPFAASGCGHSLEGDYVRTCRAFWEAANDCENYTKVAVDLDKEYRNCDDNADNFASDVQDTCGADYEILGDKVDRCVDSAHHLAEVCRDDHKSDYPEALTAFGDDCNESFVRCK